ncbi:hypothetical protein JL100_005025 [Skermanella mucosa]|uniref:hypothetical protein n=1 Tax=Skermanella mucosa TaxID=1789672 RepID=UPI00192CA45D|nr:hypothetical protein [Skermanella mucosa]UEM22119.1 hypothetical protein JL100_005025 [Skermanella mucosa]
MAIALSTAPTGRDGFRPSPEPGSQDDHGSGLGSNRAGPIGYRPRRPLNQAAERRIATRIELGRTPSATDSDELENQGEKPDQDQEADQENDAYGAADELEHEKLLYLG